jgi:hypothetical protein
MLAEIPVDASFHYNQKQSPDLFSKRSKSKVLSPEMAKFPLGHL